MVMRKVGILRIFDTTEIGWKFRLLVQGSFPTQPVYCQREMIHWHLKTVP